MAGSSSRRSALRTAPRSHDPQLKVYAYPLARWPLSRSSTRRPADLVRVTGHEHWGKSQLADAARWLSGGIMLDGAQLKPAGIEWLNESQLRVTLREGRHRQVHTAAAPPP